MATKQVKVCDGCGEYEEYRMTTHGYEIQTGPAVGYSVSNLTRWQHAADLCPDCLVVVERLREADAIVAKAPPKAEGVRPESGKNHAQELYDYMRAAIE